MDWPLSSFRNAVWPKSIPKAAASSNTGVQYSKIVKLPLTLLLCVSAYSATIEQAKKFLQDAERQDLILSSEAQRADWVKSNFITDDTEALAAKADERVINAGVVWAKEAAKYKSTPLPEDLERKMLLLRNGLTIATPANPKESEELTRIVASMEGTYGKGKYCPQPDKCLDLGDLEKILSESRDPKRLLDAWTGWHAISKPIRAPFTQYVLLANKGARELGFKDTGAMWREKYDMTPEQFASELDRLWLQVKPLYLSLHTYTRKKLREKYGPGVLPADGPIPAHLLGNMWAQTWDNIYPLLEPKDASPGYDLSEILKKRNTDAKQMARYGESFFTSLGFAPLPPTFWERSLFTKPRDRDVVCHASAWDVDFENDLRIKMCIEPTAEDFLTVHHELGHNFYQRAYNTQPFLFRDSANDGFHEAIGDTIALSVTPEYLVKIGLLDKAPDASRDIGLLLRKALEKVSFLPFALMIDKYRWQVFSGQIQPGHYNEAWWKLRREYQGIAPPAARTEADFDAAAKYHVAANVPYARYFLADILQFQFHRSLSEVAGCKEPLNRCSIYGNAEAGKRLNTMLAMGASRPWQVALQSLTGTKQMDATAIVDYFAPLQKWLDEQNKGEKVGW